MKIIFFLLPFILAIQNNDNDEILKLAVTETDVQTGDEKTITNTNDKFEKNLIKISNIIEQNKTTLEKDYKEIATNFSKNKLRERVTTIESANTTQTTEVEANKTSLPNKANEQYIDVDMRLFIKFMIICLICGLTLMVFFVSRTCIKRTSIKSLNQDDEYGEKNQAENHSINGFSKETYSTKDEKKANYGDLWMQ